MHLARRVTLWGRLTLSETKISSGLKNRYVDVSLNCCLVKADPCQLCLKELDVMLGRSLDWVDITLTVSNQPMIPLHQSPVKPAKLAINAAFFTISFIVAFSVLLLLSTPPKQGGYVFTLCLFVCLSNRLLRNL